MTARPIIENYLSEPIDMAADGDPIGAAANLSVALNLNRNTQKAVEAHMQEFAEGVRRTRHAGADETQIERAKAWYVGWLGYDLEKRGVEIGRG
jgi:hypothetical protein